MITTERVERRRKGWKLEALEEEGPSKQENDCVHLSSFVSTDCLEPSTATKELETSMTTTASPQTPSMMDVSKRSEMDSPAMHFTGRNDEAPLIAIPPSLSKLSGPTWKRIYNHVDSLTLCR